jgi:hypothetical protein
MLKRFITAVAVVSLFVAATFASLVAKTELKC